MDSETYWRERESEQLKNNIRDEETYKKEINKIYDYMMDQIQKEINGFYAKYAKAEGITMAEAKKRVSKLDIEEYSRKAEKYVKDKTFTDEANAEMRLYNATMKINRLEMLKANIGLELVDGFDELQKYFDEILTNRALKEFERQAGILGESVQNNAKAAHAVVNASFHNAKFSDRIWMYQGMMKAELSKLLQQGLIQGRSSIVLARHLRKLFGVSKSYAERLMTTELRRVQTDVAKKSYETNGNTEYKFLATNPMGPCDICKKLDGKVFKVVDMEIGKNAPPMHPQCHCCTAPHWDEEEFDEWLEFLDKGGTTEEWKQRNVSKSVAKTSKSDIMKLPRYKEAVIPKAKFTQYALNPEKDVDKARAFEKALGYTADIADELIRQIYDKLSEYTAVEKGDRGYGMTYEVIMDITGPNGKKAKVLTAWIDDKINGEMRLTTVHVDD